MTAGSYLDACGFIPASTGTGDFVVSTVVTGYQTPASAGAINAVVYSYRAESSDRTQWEIGYGAYTVASTTLARTTVTANNLGTTAKISFSAAPNVFITAATADIVNAALLQSGTLPVARINGGTANQNVQGDGTFVTSGRKLLNTLTASSSATLGDTTSITSAFPEYEIVLENILPATNSQNLNLQVHSAAAFQSTSYVSGSVLSNAGGAFSGISPTTVITLAQLNGNTGPGVSGIIKVYAPTGTTAPKQWVGMLNGNTTTPGSLLNICGGYWNANGALDGFQILFASGNIASGICKVYGNS